MNLKNQFLLALPDLNRDYFAHSLIYICEHDANGTIGLIVNRPTQTTVHDFINELGFQNRHSHKQQLVLEGGPVACDQGFILHQQGSSTSDEIVLTSSLSSLAEIAKGHRTTPFLVAVGYVGWSTGQLEAELRENLWLTTPASPDILFNTRASDMLAKAGKLLGFDYGMMAPGGRA